MKRPDQHNIDQDEAQATDYKFRRQSEEQNRRGPAPETLEGGPDTDTSPAETMNARTRQSEKDREKELEDAAGVHEKASSGESDGNDKP